MAEPKKDGANIINNSTQTVYVACKIPNGLILRLPELGDDGKPLTNVEDGGGSIFREERYVLKGYQAIDKENVMHGYGVTKGVPKEFMEEWLRQNARHPAVKAGLVFIMPDRESTRDRAADGKKLVTGFEGLNPDKDIENARRKQNKIKAFDGSEVPSEADLA